MTAIAQDALIREVYDIINSGDTSRIDVVIAPDMVDHEELGGNAPGRESFLQSIQRLRAAFPDLRVTIEDIITEGDRAAVRFTMQGTHQGEFMGLQPSGRQVVVGGIDILRVTDGRVVEHWGQTDALGLLQQIGAGSSLPDAP